MYVDDTYCCYYILCPDCVRCCIYAPYLHLIETLDLTVFLLSIMGGPGRLVAWHLPPGGPPRQMMKYIKRLTQLTWEVWKGRREKGAWDGHKEEKNDRGIEQRMGTGTRS